MPIPTNRISTRVRLTDRSAVFDSTEIKGEEVVAIVYKNASFEISEKWKYNRI